MIQLHMVPREKSAPGFRFRTHRVRQHERHGKDERREKDERNGKANGEQGSASRGRQRFGETKPRCRSATGVDRQFRVSAKGAVHVGPCIFPCYLQERIVLAMECSPRQCRLAMELPAMNCGGYTLHPTDQPNETA
jgi:hypothetical protein